MPELYDYYALLGVPPTASRDEIRDAYRRLARQRHPDVNPLDEDDAAANEFMRRLNEAYDVLNDPRRRADYDRRRWAQAPPPRPETVHRPAPGGPAAGDAGWGKQGGGGRWREPRARRVVHEQSLPRWLGGLFAVGERLKMRLEPIWSLIGIMVPVLVAALVMVIGLWAYEGVSADANAVKFLSIIVGAAGGIWAFFGVLGVLLMVFLVAWFAVWRAFNG